MDDDALIRVLRQKIEDSVNYYDGPYTDDRLQAMAYYERRPFGNELEGRSKVVSGDFAEAVDTIMPSLMKVFSSSDEAVRFEPTKPQDDAIAEQATDYCRYIWEKNNGYQNYFTWFKSALMFRIGILKIDWDATPRTVPEQYEGVNEDQYQALVDDPDIMIEEESIYPDPLAMHLAVAHAKAQVAAAAMQHAGIGAPPMPAPPGPPGAPPTAGATPPRIPPPAPIDPKTLPQLRDLKVRRTVQDGSIKVMPLPNEEFLFDQYSVDIDSSRFLCHRKRMSRSDIKEELGFDDEDLTDIDVGESEELFDLETQQRFQAEVAQPAHDENDIGDPASQRIWIYETYLRVDYDGDGIAEYRKVICAGDGYKILSNDEVENHPFSPITPIPIPHKMVGQSIFDQTKEIQDIKSTLWRQMLDNFYLTTHVRHVINPDNVKKDDILSVRPGAFIRAKNPAADVIPLQSQPIGQEALAAIEYVDTVRESRTGVTRYNQGLNADELNPTASGAQATMNAGNLRLELIARNFAETGVKRAFQRILELATKHQTRVEIIKLRGQWVPMLPTSWNADFACTVQVGLGSGNRDQELGRLMQMMTMNQSIGQLQIDHAPPGTDGPVLSMKNIYNFLRRICDVAGLKNPDQYYTDPTPFLQQMAEKAKQPQPPPPLDPKTQVHKDLGMAKLSEKHREFDSKQQFTVQKTQADFALRKQKLEQDHQRAMADLELEAAKVMHGAHADGHQSGVDAANDVLDHQNTMMGHQATVLGHAVAHHANRLNHHSNLVGHAIDAMPPAVPPVQGVQ